MNARNTPQRPRPRGRCLFRPPGRAALPLASVLFWYAVQEQVDQIFFRC